MTIKYVINKMILLMGLIMMIAPISMAAESDDSLSKVEKSKTITLGLSADYPPYEFHTKVDGKDQVVGLDVKLAEAIAKDLGVKLEIKELGFDALIPALSTGKVDMIISGMVPTPERSKEVLFSDPYIAIDQAMVIRKSDKKMWSQETDITTKNVGVQKSSAQETLLRNESPDTELTSLPKMTDIILNLKNNKVDSGLLERPVAQAYVAQNPDLMIADYEIGEVGQDKMAVALAKESKALATEINKTIENVTLENKMADWQKEVGGLLADNESFWSKYGTFYLKGTGVTLGLSVLGVLFGSLFGAVLALMKLSKNKFFKGIALVYIEYVRGTPLLVQIFLVYFGTGVLGLNLSAFAAGAIAVCLNSGAYVAEIIRAGINAVPQGQFEAARSLGLSSMKTMQKIIMPQAIKNILPALGNEFVTVIKESSVVSVIGVADLMFQAGVVQGASFKPFLPILIVSVIYFVLTFTLSRAVGVVERRLQND